MGPAIDEINTILTHATIGANELPRVTRPTLRGRWWDPEGTRATRGKTNFGLSFARVCSLADIFARLITPQNGEESVRAKKKGPDAHRAS